MKLGRTTPIASKALLLTLALILAGAAQAGATPTITKAFGPDTIGPGSVSTLTFILTNTLSAPITDLAFTDTLPAGVTIATPANASSTCSGTPTLTAPDGGTLITFADGGLGGFGNCLVQVDVTSSTIGTHMNTSSVLTSSAGPSTTPASANLTVAMDRAGFSKAFSPSTITLGSRSTLTFTIDNTLNPASIFSLTFTDVLPPGVEVAGPSNASTTCTGGAVTAAPGTNVISYGPLFPGDASVPALSSCTISVDVKGVSTGTAINSSGVLTGIVGFFVENLGKANAALTVNASEVALQKSFTDDPAPPGGTVTLEFTITNFNRTDTATSISFTDDLSTTLSGLVATGLPASDVCGAGSTLAGTSLLALTGGTLGPGESCTFSATLAIPGGATAGIYPNTTSAIGYDLGSGPETGLAASDDLFVFPAPLLTKTFLDNPVTGGDSTRMEFTITNTSPTSMATDISFLDDLTAIFPFPISAVVPATPCGAGSSISLIGLGIDEQGLFLSSGNLAAGASCTFEVTLNLPIGLGTGTYTNITGDVTATVDATTVTGSPAAADLSVVAAPQIEKLFTDDPVDAGETVTLEFTVTLPAEAPAGVTDIAFTDDLNAALTGLAATGLPMTDVCGVGSSISGTTNLTFAGGSLMPGESCVFSVTLQVPAGATPGTYTNTTSTVTATSAGLPVTGNPTNDDLLVTPLTFTKQYTDDPVIPGQTVTLEFTITNNSSTLDATGIIFTDNLALPLAGLAATGLPMSDICGTGSSISGTTFLIFVGGNLLAGESCTFSVTVQTPAAAAAGSYLNVTSSLTATIGGGPVVLPPADDFLLLDNVLLDLQKSFTDDPVSPGDTVNLAFTLTNLSATETVSSIAFTDDLGAALAGLAATGLPMTDVCGIGSSISGAGLLSFTGGTLAPGASCLINVPVVVPAGADAGIYTNTTSGVTGTAAGLPVTGGTATDDLIVLNVGFTKAFDGPSVAGGTPTLTFTITNLSAASTVAALGFTDDLDATLTGLVATGLPMTDVCGTGSAISGTSFLTFTGGTLAPLETCIIAVPLQVAAGSTAGTYPNTTSDLQSSGLVIAIPATADLVIEPPPTFAKAFAPNGVGIGTPASTLTFTIDNSASSLAATALDFTDVLPAGIEIAAPPNAATTCTGGTLTAVAGTTTISYSGGSVLATATCNVQVDVVGTSAGVHTNLSGDLTSSSGNSGNATDDLTVSAAPTFSKAFAPTAITIGGTSTLTFTIDHSAGTVDATGLDFTDTLPTGVVVATPPNAATTCTGGTVTAVAGAGVVSYSGGTVSAIATCTLSVDVTSSADGVHVNTSGDLTSSLGNSGTATDTLTVVPVPLFSKAFAPDVIASGGVSTLTFTIDNSGSALAATGLDFTDNLPAAVTVATPANAVNGCGGTLTAADGSGTITLSGGTVAAAVTCSIMVDVTSSTVGTHTNLTGDLTSSLGNSGTATDDLTVADAPLFDKTFAPAIVSSNEVSSLFFFIDNTANPIDATSVDFTDNLPAGVVVATPPNVNNICTGGTVTAVAGSGTISYTGGTVPAGTNCSIEVEVVSATPGIYTNLSGDLTSSLGNSGPATDDLTVADPPLFAKVFAPDVIAPGAPSTLTFTIDNSVNPIAVTSLDFTDNLPASVTVATPANAATTCTGGTVTAVSGSGVISYTGGTVAAGATCTLSVDVTSSTAGNHVNVSGDLTSSRGNSGPATDDLTVVGDKVGMDKTFIMNPVLRGGMIDLEYTINNFSGTFPLTDISFTDDFDSVIPGLAAVGLRGPEPCGAGSTIAGTSVVTLTGGTVPTNSSCTFTITLVVPGDAPLGSFTSSSSMVTALAGGAPVNAAPAAADLEVIYFDFTKAFAAGAVTAGFSTSLTFEITNPDPMNTATDITFSDDLDAVIPGLVAVDTPQSDVCGAGSSVTGTSVITLTGGTLAPGATCVFAVTVQIPSSAVSGTFTNVTSPLDATVSGTAATGDAADVAMATILVDANLLAIPTMSTWGFIAFVLALGALAWRRLRTA